MQPVCVCEREMVVCVRGCSFVPLSQGSGERDFYFCLTPVNRCGGQASGVCMCVLKVAIEHVKMWHSVAWNWLPCQTLTITIQAQRHTHEHTYTHFPILWFNSLQPSTQRLVVVLWQSCHGGRYVEQEDILCSWCLFSTFLHTFAVCTFVRPFSQCTALLRWFVNNGIGNGIR